MPTKKSDSKIKKPLKLLLFGRSGIGKTHLALLATPGKTLVFDTESGTDFFEGREGFQFDYWTDEYGLKTTSVRQLNSAIDWLENDVECETYETFILDVSSDIWDAIQSQRSEYKDEVAAKRGASLDERNEAVLLSFNQKDWGDMKRIWKSTIARLKTLPQNVILVAREKEIIETLPNGEIRSTGEFTYEGEKNLIYAVDFAIRLVKDDKTNKRVAVVVKTRNDEKLPEGKTFVNPTFKMFDNLVNSMDGAKKFTGTNPKDGNIFSEEETIAEEQNKIIDICRELGGQKNADLMALLTKHGATNPTKVVDLHKLGEILAAVIKFKGEVKQ
jgi:hypothetical protein